MREIPVRLLNEQRVTERARIAQEREVVGAPAFSFNLARQAELEFGLADQVERDIGERDVFFEDRRMPAPGADAMGEDRRLIAHAEREFEKRHICFHRRRHMCPTSSGMS
jgi:hypothetical protein